MSPSASIRPLTLDGTGTTWAFAGTLLSPAASVTAGSRLTTTGTAFDFWPFASGRTTHRGPSGVPGGRVSVAVALAGRLWPTISSLVATPGVTAIGWTLVTNGRSLASMQY